MVLRMLKSGLEQGHFDQNGRLDHFGPVHFPTVLRPLPSLEGHLLLKAFRVQFQFRSSTRNGSGVQVPSSGLGFSNRNGSEVQVSSSNLVPAHQRRPDNDCLGPAKTYELGLS